MLKMQKLRYPLRKSKQPDALSPVSQTTASRPEIPSSFPGVGDVNWLQSIPQITELQSVSLHRREKSQEHRKAASCFYLIVSHMSDAISFPSQKRVHQFFNHNPHSAKGIPTLGKGPSFSLPLGGSKILELASHTTLDLCVLVL